MNDLEREVAPDVVDDISMRIDNLAKGTVLLVDGLIVFFVIGTAGHEIGNSLFFFHVLVIGRAKLDLVHIGNQNGFVVTDRFDKNRLDVVLFLFESFHNVLAALPGAVGCIECGHPHTVLRHVLHQIGQSRVAGDLSLGNPIGVFGIVKGGRLLRSAELPTVVSNIENLRGNVVKETQKAADSLGNVRLPRCWQTNHDDDQLVRGGGSHDLQRGRIVSLRQNMRQWIVFAHSGVPGSSVFCLVLVDSAVVCGQIGHGGFVVWD
mmetsp:Transcript_14143/g.35532  ORF Transcript_14143/g.35532 Transcript_14143/m.35532 type:complete len:263 (-) Transcript_14143:228-1016(-)